jgi:hypothetical protein
VQDCFPHLARPAFVPAADALEPATA